jgi:hypothetical protein
MSLNLRMYVTTNASTQLSDEVESGIGIAGDVRERTLL